MRSNCIPVGPVRVAANAERHDHPVTGPMMRQFLTVNRSGRPEDVAAMVAFLASEESSWISGDTLPLNGGAAAKLVLPDLSKMRSEEHTSELQSLMRISYAVFCLKKKKTQRSIKLQLPK